MKFPGWGVFSVLALGAVLSASASGAHPLDDRWVKTTVIANFPINGPAYYGPSTVVNKPTVIANFPIHGHGAYPGTLPVVATYAPAHYQGASVPVALNAPVPVQPAGVAYTPVITPVPAPMPAPVVYVPAPAPAPVLAPVVTKQVTQQVIVVAAPHPQDCICARSASGGKVNVYRTAGRWQSTPVTKLGGGKKTIDVRGFHQNHWRVSYRDANGGAKYGWVRHDDLVCLEKRAPRSRW